jgi:signal transduction histidine kinase
MINLLIGAICIFVYHYRAGRPWLIYGAGFHVCNAIAYALTIPYNVGPEMSAHMRTLGSIPITMVLAGETWLVPATVLALYGRWLPLRRVALLSLATGIVFGIIAWAWLPFRGYQLAHGLLMLNIVVPAASLLRGPTAFYRLTGISLVARGGYAVALISMAFAQAPAWAFETALLINLVFICLTGLGMVLIELDDARARIVEADHAKTLFIANMSHELRTPLNAIIGFSEMMAGDHMPVTLERCRDYAGDILSSGRHLLSMINQLLDMASIEARKERFDIETLDLVAVAGACLNMIGSEADAKQIQVRLEKSATSIAMATDQRALRQILLCLLGNAVKFSPAGTQITLVVRLDESASHARIIVRDQGPGINGAHLRSIFEPFWQAQDTYSRSKGGVGLGLAITKRLVESLDGRIEVESQIGQGSSFIVTLPLLPRDKDADRAASSGQFWRRTTQLSSQASE